MSIEECCQSTRRSTTRAVVNPYLKKPAKLLPTRPLSVATVPVEKSSDPSEQLEPFAETLQKTPQNQHAVHSTPSKRHHNYGQHVPMEQRLASRIVTFRSAEHLSVTELREFLTCYTDRSVRITGVVLHRHVVESDSSVCLVLSDPLADTTKTAASTRRSGGGDATPPPATTTTPTTIKPRKDTPTREENTTPSASTPSRRYATAQTPLDRTTPSSAKRAPLLGSKRKLVHVPRNASDMSSERTPLIGGSRSKRMQVYVPTRSTPRNSLLKGKTRRSSVGDKRRLSFSTPTESAIYCLVNQPTSVLVVANPIQHPQVADCGVGDIIMVIGEVVIASHDSPTAKAFISQYQKRMERLDENQVRYLKPRILRNVNGTNVRLQYEAILQRRSHVSQLSKDPNQVGPGPPRTKDTPFKQTEYVKTDPAQNT